MWCLFFPALQKHHEEKVGKRTLALALLAIYEQLLLRGGHQPVRAWLSSVGRNSQDCAKLRLV